MSEYHKPALLEECLLGLNIKPNGCYVDVTFGGGGHSKAILKQINNGKLYAFDQDEDALKNQVDDDRLVLIHGNFKYLKNYLKYYNVLSIDGLIADLGVSSYQFDMPQKGFSIRMDSPLDMRMNNNSEVNAQKVVNNYTVEKLSDIFYQYGELKSSKQIAKRIVNVRKAGTIETTGQLRACVESLFPANKQNKGLAQVFQAIRIEVNDELSVLKALLKQAVTLLNPNGRLAVISYHSLEDRLVKNFFKTGNFEGKPLKDFYGNLERPLKPVNNKVIIPTEEEIKENNRVRSAKLRIAEKV